VLTPIYTDVLPRLHGNVINIVSLHMDKSLSYTSNATRNFLQQIVQDTGVNTVPYSRYTGEVTHVSPMDFCEFNLLKRALSSRRVTTFRGLLKACERSGREFHFLYLIAAFYDGSYGAGLLPRYGDQIGHWDGT